MTENVDATRESIAKATRMAGMAASDFASARKAELAGCTPNDQAVLLTQVVVAYLLGRGLVTIAPDEAWDTWLNVTVPEPFDADIDQALAEAQETQRRMNAAVFG